MSFAIRPGTAADFPEIQRVDDVAFGYSSTEQDREDTLMVLDPTRFLVATDADRIVGMTADYRFSMSIPGASIDLPGVTWVSVAITHRRRGILTALMHRQLQGYAQEGCAAAVLTASEGGIYERFGYGAASEVRHTTIDRRRARLRRPVASPEVQVMPGDQACSLLPDLYERWRRGTPGAVSRSGPWWDRWFLDRDSQRNGMTSMFHLVHPQGYVSFRVHRSDQNGREAQAIWIVDYVITSSDAHAALWQILLGMDLYDEVGTQKIPSDDPLRYQLLDARDFVCAGVNDGVWLRPIDVVQLLTARTYALEVDAVIEVADPLLGDGRYRLQAGPDGATCTRTDVTPGVRLDAAALGSVYLGGHRVARLAAANRIGIDDRALLTRLDLAFLADRVPFHGTGF